ncbi:hypothetical protein AB0Y14_08375 [Rothia sp. HC945]|uniref:hypothetical protein n=1 Tax=Rothia sp. HC945 TaxID=3171170 RepID=UPI003F23EF3C
MATPEGTLNWTPLLDAQELVAQPVADAARAGAVPGARVAAISETLADTAEFCEAYDVAPEASANCVIVRGKRGESVTDAAVIVLATDRADVNKTVVFILALWAFCTGMFIIAVLPPSAEEPFEHHPFWTWKGSLFTVVGLGLGLGLIVSLAWDGLKALCEWMSGRNRSKQRPLISGESKH